jgi:hypothetical protein
MQIQTLSPIAKSRIIAGGLIAAAVLFGIVLLWWLTGTASMTALRLWAFLMTLALLVALPVAALLAFYVGHVEARGYMHGADRTLGNVVSLVSAVTAIREPKPDPAISVTPTALPTFPPPTVVLEDHAGLALIAEQVGYGAPIRGMRELTEHNPNDAGE